MSGTRLHRAIPNPATTKDGKITLEGFNRGLTEEYIKDSANCYTLYKELNLEVYRLYGYVEGKYFLEEYKHIRDARSKMKKLVTLFTTETKPVERQKLYKISIGVRKELESKGYYRDVAHYKEENKQFPKNTLLQKSKKETSWVYADTMTQE